MRIWLGVLRIEMIELENGIHQRDFENIKHELCDIASAAIFALACMHKGSVKF